MSLNRKSLFKRRDSVAAYMTNDSVKVDGNITIITCKVHAKKKMTPTEMESYYKNFFQRRHSTEAMKEQRANIIKFAQ